MENVFEEACNALLVTRWRIVYLLLQYNIRNMLGVQHLAINNKIQSTGRYENGISTGIIMTNAWLQP